MEVYKCASDICVVQKIINLNENKNLEISKPNNKMCKYKNAKIYFQ
jgi:hypothetical protein